LRPRECTTDLGNQAGKVRLLRRVDVNARRNPRRSKKCQLSKIGYQIEM
jgi:hypothetical protein